MVRREKVTDERGRRWLQGDLDSDTWFDMVKQEARRQAELDVAQRLARAGRSAPRARRLRTS